PRARQVIGAVAPRDGNVVEAAHGSALPGDRWLPVPYTSGRLNIATFVRRALAETLIASELATAETPKVVGILNRTLELELAGLVRYLHYSFMIFGHNRIPIVAWLRAQADEAQAHS